MTRNQAIVDASGGGFAAIISNIYEREWQCGVHIACDNLQSRKLGGS